MTSAANTGNAIERLRDNALDLARNGVGIDPMLAVIVEEIQEDAAAVDALHQAAKAKRAHDHQIPALLDDGNYESWARENMALGQAVDAAVRRVEGE